DDEDEREVQLEQAEDPQLGEPGHRGDPGPAPRAGGAAHGADPPYPTPPAGVQRPPRRLRGRRQYRGLLTLSPPLLPPLFTPPRRGRGRGRPAGLPAGGNRPAGGGMVGRTGAPIVQVGRGATQSSNALNGSTLRNGSAQSPPPLPPKASAIIPNIMSQMVMSL